MAHITLSQLTTVLQRIVSWATGKFAAKNTYSGKLEYADMPVVVLASMGSELDGTSTQRPMSAGDTYYLPAGQGAGARIMFVNSIGTAVKISDPVSNVIYCNAYTGLLYRWDASEEDMIPVGGTSSGSIDVSGKADLLAGTGMLSPAQWPKVVLRNVSDTMLDDLASGDVYFDTGHLYLYKGDNQNPVDLGEPSSKIIYFCLADGKMYRWNGNTFQPILATVATSGSYNDLSNKPTIPTKVSDLTNDSGFVTDEDIEDFVTAESIEEIVMGSADVMVVETPGYIDIVFAEASITVSEDNLVLTEASPNGTFNVSGSHLKDDITVTAPTGFKVQLAGGTAQQSVTIPHVNGTVESTTVTVNAMPTLVSDVLQGNVELESGAVSASVGVYYSQYAGPTILADSTLTIKAAAGQSNTGSLRVTGLNLTAGITATVSGTGFTVSSSESGTYGDQASLPSSGGTLYVKFSPAGSSASTGTLTLASTGATSKTVDLTGAVSTLTVSPQSLTFSTDQGVAVTDTFTVLGVNLTEGVTITKTDTNGVFSVSPSSISKTDAEASAQTVTVTYQSSSAGSHSGSLAITSGNLSESITLAGTAAAAATSDAEGKFTKLDANGNTLYLKRIIVDGAKTTEVEVHQSNYLSEWNSSVAETYGGNIVIPSTVVVDGVTCTVTRIATNAFRYGNGGDGNGNGKLKSLVLPDTITYIGMYFLYYAKSITEVTIPASVTYIGDAFCGNKCTSLTTINMLCAQNQSFSKTTFGGNYTPNLNGCSVLTEFVYPDKVTEIPAKSLSGCTSLTKVTLGTDMAIFRNIFTQATAVTTIICRGTTPPVINGSGQSFGFGNEVLANATVYVPNGYVATYSAVSPWSSFANDNRLKEISELPNI